MRRAEEVDGQRSATDTDDRQVAEHPGHLSGHRERRIHADHVEHQLGALSPRHVLDALDCRIAREQPLVGAHAFGGLKLVGRGVHGDDRRRGAERSQYLDGHLAQAAGTDHDGGGAGP